MLFKKQCFIFQSEMLLFVFWFLVFLYAGYVACFWIDLLPGLGMVNMPQWCNVTVYLLLVSPMSVNVRSVQYKLPLGHLDYHALCYKTNIRTFTIITCLYLDCADNRKSKK